MQPLSTVQPITPAELGQPVEPTQPAQSAAPAQLMQTAPFVQHVVPVQAVQLDRTHPLVQPIATTSAVSLTSRAIQVVYLVLGIVEALLLVRVALKLLAANASTTFSALVYGVSQPLVAPFQGVFPTPTAHSNVLELSSLVAIVVYALIAWGLVQAIALFARQQPRSTAS
jgi:uncharacterized protein YggT (Ycf19 family)